jgi:acetyl esterase/lipase
MKKVFIYIVFILFWAHFSLAQEKIMLWPQGKMPNSKGVMLSDTIIDGRLFQVGNPRVYVYPATKDKNTGAAILIVPGGGYLRLTADYSNIPIASYYQEHGINAFVVCHRMPASPDLEIPEIAPWQDIQRTMRIIRANAEKWGIDPNRVGVFGGSAGGHGASTLATHNENISAIGDELDNYSYAPAFMILLSPAISFESPIVHKGSRDRLLRANNSEELISFFSNEKHVTQSTPPAFLVHANDDGVVSPLNSIVFYQALKNARVESSLHIFPYGGHRLGIGNCTGAAAIWPDLSIDWLKEMKFIE